MVTMVRRVLTEVCTVPASAFSFNCFIETGGLRKVTGSHVYCKRSNISVTVQDGDVVCYYRPLIGSDIWLIE